LGWPILAEGLKILARPAKPKALAKLAKDQGPGKLKLTKGCDNAGQKPQGGET